MSTARLQPIAKRPLGNKSLDRPLAKGSPGPSLQKLTDAIEKRLLDWAKDDTHARVEMGGLIEQVRDRLDHGEWLAWRAQHLPFSERGAQQFIELHRWAKRHAVRFAKLAPLGPSKLYLLMRQRDALVLALLARSQHVVPSTGKRKSTVRMTVSELTEVVRRLDGVPDPDPTTVFVDRYRTRVLGIVRATEAIIEHGSEVSPDQVEDMHDALLTAASRLAEAFDLEN